MISHLEIQDFAVIKDLSLDLQNGLNIITGETGAGKSVIIEAVSMVLGARADTDYIRHGCDKAYISMLIDTDDNQYLIKREISQGKSVCRINGELVSLAELSAFCKKLVDIHGQYDNQSLLNPDNHIIILDLFGGEDIAKLKSEVGTAYRNYAEASLELMNLRKSVSEGAKQKDFLAFELNEIQSANIILGEDDELEEKIKLMENSENIFEALSSAHNSIFSDEGSAFDVLGNALRQLENVSEYSSDISLLTSRISDAYYSLEDINSDLRHLKESVNFSQEDLDTAIERLEVLKKLKKKYGGDLQSVLNYADDAAKKLDSIENFDERMSQLENEIQKLRTIYDNSAEKLFEKRKSFALVLENQINTELSELNFARAEFKVSFKKGNVSENGTDIVEFLISANVGEEPKALAKIASGGELSRIMLALKRIIGDIDGIETMIFDEIDAGISGATAGVVGKKLKSIAEKHQIICITHLPQIACMGDFHYRIEKHSDEISTQTTVVPLSNDERIEELARLLSGMNITDSARAQAKELLCSR